VRRGRARDAEQREAVAGAVFANLIAAFIIIATGATLFTHGVHSISSAADAARAPRARSPAHYAEVLFGGRAARRPACWPPRSCRSATSYVVSESLGYEKGVGRRREDAPVFVNIITAMIMLSAFVAIIPGVPGDLVCSSAVQVVNGPAAADQTCFFIWRLARSRQVMGEATQPRAVLDGATAITVAVTSTLSIGLVVITVLGL